MSDVVTAKDLLPGDVLLYHGTGWISRMIRLFDGSDVNHAGLYLGDEKVGEAIAGGLKERSLAESREGCEFVRVRRLKADAAMGPVLAKGREYLAKGQRYAYEQIVMLALLSLSKQLKLNPILRWLINRALYLAAAVLERLISGKTEPMICSEFVYRAYDEALPAPDDPYTLHIPRQFPDVGLDAKAAAFASAPGAPALAAPVGVHPNSLLAVLMARAGQGALATTGSIKLAAAKVPMKKVSDKEMNKAVDAYLATCDGKTPSVPVADVSLDQLADTADRFALSFCRAMGKKAGPPRAAVAAAAVKSFAASGSKMPLYAYLWKTCADFVTPAGLNATDDLLTRGELKP